VEQVALGDPLVRPEDLVEIRELDAALGLSGDRHLALDLARRLVLAQTEERGSPKMPVVRPLRELDLADELRLDPHDVALANLRHLRDGCERRGVASQRLELREQVVDLPLGETGSAVADPLQLVTTVGGEHERAEAAGTPPLALRPADDHELLTPVGLDLEPVARALSLEVARPAPLRHHSLELLLERRVVQRPAVVEEAGDLHRLLALVEQRLQSRAAFDEGQIEDRNAVDLEHVEDR